MWETPFFHYKKSACASWALFFPPYYQHHLRGVSSPNRAMLDKDNFLFDEKKCTSCLCCVCIHSLILLTLSLVRLIKILFSSMCLLNILANFPKQAAREEWKLFFLGTKSSREECEELNFFHSRSLFFFSPDELVRWWWWVQIHPSHRRRRGLPSSAKLSARVSEECKTTSAYKKNCMMGKKTSSCEIYTIAIAVRRERHLHTSSALWKMYVYMENTKKKVVKMLCVVRGARGERRREK